MGTHVLSPRKPCGSSQNGLLGADFEEVAAGDARIVFLVVNLAGGEVEGGEVGGKEGNVRAVDLGEAVLVGNAGG